MRKKVLKRHRNRKIVKKKAFHIFVSLIVTSFSALFQPKSVRFIKSTTGGNAEAYAYSYTRAKHIS